MSLLLNITPPSKALDDLYHERAVRQPDASPLVQALYKELVGDGPYTDKAQALFHTQFHAVEKKELSNPLGIRW